MERQRLKIYNPNDISMFEIEYLINKGYRFDLVDGLADEEYDKVEVLLSEKDVVR